MQLTWKLTVYWTRSTTSSVFYHLLSRNICVINKVKILVGCNKFWWKTMNFEGNWELDSFKLDFKNNHFPYAYFFGESTCRAKFQLKLSWKLIVEPTSKSCFHSFTEFRQIPELALIVNVYVNQYWFFLARLSGVKEAIIKRLS